MEIIQSFPAFFVGYVHSLPVMPTIIYVAIIALFFGLITQRLAGVIIVPILATAIFIAAQIIMPVVLNHAVLAAPVFDLAFAKLAVAGYIVFLVLDTVVFAIKKLILKIVG